MAPPYKFNGTSYDISSFSFGSWDTDRTMNPGEGAFILAARGAFRRECLLVK